MYIIRHTKLRSPSINTKESLRILLIKIFNICCSVILLNTSPYLDALQSSEKRQGPSRANDHTIFKIHANSLIYDHTNRFKGVLFCNARRIWSCRRGQRMAPYPYPFYPLSLSHRLTFFINALRKQIYCIKRAKTEPFICHIYYSSEKSLKFHISFKNHLKLVIICKKFWIYVDIKFTFQNKNVANERTLTNFHA